MTNTINPEVQEVLRSYPRAVQRRVLATRSMIFTAASQHPQIGEIHETLKWGEPAYLPVRKRCGTTLRLSWKSARPEHWSLFVPCSTTLIDDYRALFPELTCIGSREIRLRTSEVLPAALESCVLMALTYHKPALRGSSRPRTDGLSRTMDATTPAAPETLFNALRKAMPTAKLARIPKHPGRRDLVLATISTMLERRYPYTERELKESLEEALVRLDSEVDHVTCRRYLVDCGFLKRDRAGTRYYLNYLKLADTLSPAACEAAQEQITRAQAANRKRLRT